MNEDEQPPPVVGEWYYVQFGSGLELSKCLAISPQGVGIFRMRCGIYLRGYTAKASPPSLWARIFGGD